MDAENKDLYPEGDMPIGQTNPVRSISTLTIRLDPRKEMTPTDCFTACLRSHTFWVILLILMWFLIVSIMARSWQLFSMRTAMMPVVYRDCQDAHRHGDLSTLINMAPDGGKVFLATCDHNDTQGGWTVFQKRTSGKLNFNRSWYEFDLGFGFLEGEYWLGNRQVNRLTYGRNQKLRILLTQTNSSVSMVYDQFLVYGVKDDYRVHLDGYKGDEGFDMMTVYDGFPFSTWEHYKVNPLFMPCVRVEGYGWWFPHIPCTSGFNPNQLWTPLGISCYRRSLHKTIYANGVSMAVRAR